METVNQFCPDHSNLVQAVGRVEGRQMMVLERLESIDSKLAQITTNGIKNAQAIEVERQKIKPVYWVLAIIAGTAMIAIVNKALVVWVGF